MNVCFSNPTSPPWSAIGLVPCLAQCVSAYTLSSPALKGVTCRMDVKHTHTHKHFPTPCYPRYMQVQPGAWSKPTI